MKLIKGDCIEEMKIKGIVHLKDVKNIEEIERIENLIIGAEIRDTYRFKIIASESKRKGYPTRLEYKGISFYQSHKSWHILPNIYYHKLENGKPIALYKFSNLGYNILTELGYIDSLWKYKL